MIVAEKVIRDIHVSVKALPLKDHQQQEREGEKGREKVSERSCTNGEDARQESRDQKEMKRTIEFHAVHCSAMVAEREGDNSY